MAKQAAIFHFNDERTEIVRSVIRCVIESTPDPLYSLNDAAFQEVRRLEKSGRGEAERQELKEWRRIAKTIGRMSDRELRDCLADAVEKMTWDVAGNFNPWVFEFSRKLLPTLITGLLSPKSIQTKIRHPGDLFDLDRLTGQVGVEGPLERIRSIANRGTLIFVPTHLSNMDSIIFGYALERAKLPPVTYGAGKNLFTNPVLSFFMRNLGAYRVDRRIGHALYKQVLKTYSSMLLERGYHSLFFPGGTRSRSGCVERKLKLGLVGSVYDAYVRSAQSGLARRMYFVPATINYRITLEARTLISDFLAESGKGRFIIEDDESSRFDKVAAFIQKILRMDGSLIVRFGDPLDPFGNIVDSEGDSFDSAGHRVDPISYLRNYKGEIEVNVARDAQYARELGEELCRAYARDTVIMPTHLVAAAAFERLRESSMGSDVFSVVRQKDLNVPRLAVEESIARLREKLLNLVHQKKICVSNDIREDSPAALLSGATYTFSSFHSTEVIALEGAMVRMRDPEALFYYQNRLAAHGLAWDVAATLMNSRARGVA